MTAKEKANELINSFYFHAIEDNNYAMEYSDGINCALICVDTILKGSRLFYIEDYTYWEEVKQEIKQL
jgi:hypothetical protein